MSNGVAEKREIRKNIFSRKKMYIFDIFVYQVEIYEIGFTSYSSANNHMATVFIGEENPPSFVVATSRHLSRTTDL